MDSGESLIWEQQQQFQQTALSYAQGLFKVLDEKLNPTIFLVGIEVDERDDPQSVCTGSVLYRQSLSENLDANLKKATSEHFLHGNSDADEFVSRTSLTTAILSTIQQQDEALGRKSFCSWPQYVNNYLVSVVLQLDSSTYNSYYSLLTDKIGLRPIDTSLIGTVAHLCLREFSIDLALNFSRRNYLFSEGSYEDMFRLAGYFLMLTPLAKAGTLNRENDLFSICSKVSSEKYETRECSGGIIVARKGHEDIEVVISFTPSIKLTAHKLIRKLLETSRNNLALLANDEEIYGIGKKRDSYNSEQEDLFEINFKSHYQWELLHDNRTLMQVHYGLPHLPKERIVYDAFEQQLETIFSDIQEEQIEKLWPLIQAAIEQSHGTTLVIVKDAADEASRLQYQAIKIDPIILTPEMMQNLTAIDGAVLVDLDAYCHAIGVILDGEPSERGDLSRGARYNSAVRYTDAKDGRLAIVVSVDGGIDLIHKPLSSD